MATTRVRAKQIIQAPLPPLNVGTYRTTSSAIHKMEYVGTLSPWPNFKSTVEAIYNAQAFSRCICVFRKTNYLIGKHSTPYR
ncbi:unnamed protein product [Penicillium roqueforti FM164]|uniref:Uncharacterized protein n=1 Tax=Penicillium roqueforti (strain FM164) TaxID=1365484 RepID=W6QRC2_PENRF|nr:unnamed protein product [Penicillium roqueforti FM164]